MGKIHFHCPKCGKAVSIPHQHAGKRGKCPGCSAIFEIPKAESVQTALSVGQLVVGLYLKEYLNGQFSKTVMIEEIKSDPDFGDSVLLSNGRCPDPKDILRGFANDYGQTFRYELASGQNDCDTKAKPCVLCGVTTAYRAGKGLNTVALDTVGIRRLYVICKACSVGDTLSRAKRIQAITEGKREQSSADS
jgi:hypothetical protein